MSVSTVWSFPEMSFMLRRNKWHRFCSCRLAFGGVSSYFYLINTLTTSISVQLEQKKHLIIYNSKLAYSSIRLWCGRLGRIRQLFPCKWEMVIPNSTPDTGFLLGALSYIFNESWDFRFNPIESLQHCFPVNVVLLCLEFGARHEVVSETTRRDRLCPSFQRY